MGKKNSLLEALYNVQFSFDIVWTPEGFTLEFILIECISVYPLTMLLLDVFYLFFLPH